MFDFSTETLRFRSNLTPLVGGTITISLMLLLGVYVLKNPTDTLMVLPIFPALVVLGTTLNGAAIGWGALLLGTLPFLYRSFGDWHIGLVGGVIVLEMYIGLKGAQFLSEMVRRRHRDRVLERNALSEEINLLREAGEKEESRVQALEEKGRRFRRLGEIAGRLGESLEEQEVCRRIADDTGRLFAGKFVALFMKKRGRFLLQATAGVPLENTEPEGLAEDEFNQIVLRTGVGVTVADVRRDFRFRAEGKRGFLSLVAAPVICEGAVEGVLRVHGIKPDAFQTDDLRLVTHIAQLGSVAIQNARLFSKTEEMAMIDGLTKLAKRWYFNDRFQDECQRALRYRGKISLLITDIDKFKSLNDNYGHLFGDKVLATVAAVVKEELRAIDIAGRWGGEEFAIVLPNMDRRGACEAAERIRGKVEREVVRRVAGDKPVTVSIGVATFPDDIRRTDRLFDAADAALYKAKAEGRNRVVVSGEDPSRGKR
ncbi:MAG: GGDEF domain-containing protein [Candidatus Hydrogenedentota bacterium]|nr:MAG: GGDEF domain-containing protein [Candidatus Hydrogenedentota bacterium]